jgi:DNA-binding LacI/PurR family transcriptional regulator
LTEHGYELVLAPMNYDMNRFAACLHRLVAWRVEGLLVLLCGRTLSRENQKELDQLGLPYLLVDAKRGKVPPPSTEASVASGILLGEHLAHLGHRRIAFVTGNLDNQHSLDRLHGLRLALKRQRIQLPDHAIVTAPPGHFGTTAGWAAMQSLLNAKLDITAVVCANDLVGLCALRFLDQAGIRVPEDVSVAGFDDISVDSTITEHSRLATYFSPPLTTVRMPFREFGVECAQYLIGLLEDPEPRKPLAFKAAPELIVRDSTAPPTSAAQSRLVHLARGIER